MHAVVRAQIEQVLAAQQPELDAIDSTATLRRWADRLVAMNEDAGSAGGCPLGRLSSELAENDPIARSELNSGFTAWQQRLAAGLRTMQRHNELDPHADPDTLALGLLAAVQGGLLLAQTARGTRPLQAALDLVLRMAPRI